MPLKSRNDRKKATIHVISAALSFVIMGLLLISYIQMGIQASYATTSSNQEVRTLRIKVHLDKSIVAQGGTQAMRFQVYDEKSHQPIGGAITSATINYADGKTVRQFSAATDASGRSSISWQIESNAPLGTYGMVYSVFETGYVSQSNFGTSFSVVAHGMGLNKSTNNYYYGSSSLSITAPSLRIERSIHTKQYYN